MNIYENGKMFFKGYIKICETAVRANKKLDFSVNCEKCHEIKSDYQSNAW